MRYSTCKFIKLLFVGLSWILFSNSKIYANDWLSEIRVFNKSFEATITSSGTIPFQTSKDIYVKYDPMTISYYGRVLSKVVGEDGHDKKWDDEYSQNSRSTSESLSLMSSTDLKRIDFNPRTKDAILEAVVLKALRIPFIQSAYLPLHEVMYPEVKQTELIKETPLENNITLYEYIIKSGEGYDLKATYEVEFSEGIKILSGKIEEDDNVIEEVRNSNHIKQNGIWIAKDIECSIYSNGKKAEDYHITIKDIALGNLFEDKDFVIKPSVGDDIYDNIMGRRYTYGYATAEMASENSLHELSNLNNMANTSDLQSVVENEKKNRTDVNETQFNISGNQNQQEQVNQKAPDNEDAVAIFKRTPLVFNQ